ncbi:MAG: flagellar basal body rod C-terminal domain-containing protein [Rickettsiaceae bacterium]|nr:flagellar basal body rod C-terminal domain-containing protein [Rickettsiaceae bacterium]
MRKIIVLFSVLFASSTTSANNAFYISIANQIAKKYNMEIVANNAANLNTIGYEEDAALFNATGAGMATYPQTNFVEVKGIYKTGELGPLKKTGLPLDLSVAENRQYLKLLTPKGKRLTLSSSFTKNQDGLIVSMNGYPLLSIDEDVIELPQEASRIEVLSNGIVMADDAQVGQVGVFYLENRNALVKEGDSLYIATGAETPLENYYVISGALRSSNVNPSRIITQAMESQRSFSGATSLISEIGDLEKQAVNKILKAQ